MRAFRRHAWALRNAGMGAAALGMLLQWRGNSDGPLLLLVGVVVAFAAGLRNKIDQDLKIAALHGYEEALTQLEAYRGDRAEKLRENGWAELMIDGKRREWEAKANEHYHNMCGLRFIPLRPSLPRLFGAELEEWRYVAETMVRQSAPGNG